MADADATRALSRLLGAAGRAHHEIYGGPNPEWASWYAEKLAGDIDEHLGFSPTVEQLTDWLTRADARHRAEAPDRPWPPFYAELFLDEFRNE